MLDDLICQLNDAGYHVAWAQTIDDCAGFIARAHHIIVLAADRTPDILCDIAREALGRISTLAP